MNPVTRRLAADPSQFLADLVDNRMNLTWTDNAFSSRRSDGAIIGGFVIDGRVEWWAHPQGISTKDGRANGIGPFPTRELAKRALDPEEVQAWTTARIPFPDAQPSALS